MTDPTAIDQMEIGIRIRQLRLAQNRTMQDLADRSQLSKSMISKIESSKAIPSIAALVKIASALGVGVGDILEKDSLLSTELTLAGEVEANLTATEKGYRIFPFAPGVHLKKMQPFLCAARKGEVKQHSLTHQGEEFIYVLEGSLKIRVGQTEYLLKRGDSIYFNPVEPHGILPESESVKYLDVFV